MSYKNNIFKISSPTWNDKFELPYGSYTTSDIQDYFKINQQKNYWRTYDKIWKIATGQGDDYITGCLIEYLYFEIYYKLIAIDLSKQQRLDVYQKQYTRLILL